MTPQDVETEEDLTLEELDGHKGIIEAEWSEYFQIYANLAEFLPPDHEYVNEVIHERATRTRRQVLMLIARLKGQLARKKDSISSSTDQSQANQLKRLDIKRNKSSTSSPVAVNFNNKMINEKAANINHEIHQGEADEQSVLLATARVKVISRRRFMTKARALIDHGSEVSFISEQLVNQLHLQRRASTVERVEIGGINSGHTRGIVSVNLQASHGTHQLQLNAHILKKLTAIIPSFSCSSARIGSLQNLQLSDPHYLRPGPIDIILGADNYGRIIMDEVVKSEQSRVVGQRTVFGWILSGPIECTNCSIKVSLSAVRESSNEQLLELLQKFWVQEELPNERSSTSELSPDEHECEMHFRATHSRDNTGRYILYREFINEYAALGHMRIAPETPEPVPAYYLPHHGVLKEVAITTKLRVVFNGCSPSSSGMSLNDILYSGEKLQNDAMVILTWMRRHRLVFGTDIVKMFRQIRVHQDDWDLHRILRIDENQQPVTYQLTTVTYGLNRSPWLSLRVLQQLAEDEGHRFSAAVETLTRGRYVDGIYGGAETEDGLKENATQL
ncbi:uncharacterized protein LOC107046145 [Diachasma alloeum]|uniref:uncharacterized protein LOC107046145 n=1 Tax=Diachasma alloeum TaxID=454923 RepID=UPI000738322B|nr:uncharacterized protein LOC107046145 [Diachasma alloeum]